MQRKSEEMVKRLAMGVSCTDAAKPVAKSKAIRVNNDDKPDHRKTPVK
jgi:hypothetical protein